MKWPKHKLENSDFKNLSEAARGLLGFREYIHLNYNHQKSFRYLTDPEFRAKANTAVRGKSEERIDLDLLLEHKLVEEVPDFASIISVRSVKLHFEDGFNEVPEILSSLTSVIAFTSST